MPNSNIVMLPDLTSLIAEREKVWEEVDRSQKLSAQLDQLSSHVPKGAPAELQLAFGTDSTPPAELEMVLPMLNEQIKTASKLNAEVKECYAQIEAIKHQEKMIMIGAVVGGAVVLIVLVLVIINLVSGP
jgi:hypothetical protein